MEIHKFYLSHRLVSERKTNKQTVADQLVETEKAEGCIRNVIDLVAQIQKKC